MRPILLLFAALVLTLLVSPCLSIVFGHSVRYPEASMSTVEIIRSRGYACTVYHVTTEDGYILELHRIGSSSGRPVLLQHGLLSTDVDWVTNPTNQSLGYLLSDRGYDVWLANSRGNTYSRKHAYLDPKQPSYWNFSYKRLIRIWKF